VELVFQEFDSASTYQIYRIDEQQSNAFAAWKAMGSPQEPTGQQYEQLVAAGKLASPTAASRLTEIVASRRAATVSTQSDTSRPTAALTFELPRKGVALVVIDLSEPVGK
jgi:xylan 1,4-beta-xylosidase